jgi:hypothetical protein
MAVRNNFAAGEVLAAADLNDTFGAKANLASPTFTGTPAAPTAAAGTNTTQIATTAFVQAAGGMVLVTSQSFSAVSSVSVNNCFTATYENYRIVIKATSGVGGGSDFYLRYRASGTDASSGDYFNGHMYVTAGSGPNRDYRAAATSALIGYAADLATISTFDVASPRLSERTSGNATYATLGSSGSLWGTAGHVLNNTTAYDGFTIFVGSGNITGSLRVYGYRNS